MKPKNPRRVAAGKVAYGIKKTAQDEHDKGVMQIISGAILLIVLFGLLIKSI